MREISMSFYIFRKHRVCLVEHVDLICSLYNWWEGFGSSSLATLTLGFNCCFYFHLCMWVVHWGLHLEYLGLPYEAQVWRWCSCLGCRDSVSTRYSGELAARAAGNIVL